MAPFISESFNLSAAEKGHDLGVDPGRALDALTVRWRSIIGQKNGHGRDGLIVAALTGFMIPTIMT